MGKVLFLDIAFRGFQYSSRHAKESMILTEMAEIV